MFYIHIICDKISREGCLCTGFIDYGLDILKSKIKDDDVYNVTQLRNTLGKRVYEKEKN